MHQVNFLPMSYRRRDARRRRAWRQGVLIALLGLCLLGWWGVQTRQTGALRREANELMQQVETAQGRTAEVARLRAERQRLIQQVEIQRELAQPLRHTQVLAALGELLPPSVAVTHLAMHTQRPAPLPPPPRKKDDEKDKSTKKLPEPAPAPRGEHRLNLDLAGIAPDDLTVANVLTALKLHPVFSDVKMHYSRNIELEGVHGRQFRLELAVDLDRRFEPLRSGKGVAHVD